MIDTSLPVEKYYDKLAEVYDNSTSKPAAWTPPSYVAKELSRLKKTPKNILIVGVGTGQDIVGLSLHNGCHIEGIDISSEMLARAAIKFPSVILHHGDFMTFNGFLVKDYDLIICSGVLEFISDFSGFFEKTFKILKNSGTLLVTFEPIIIGHKAQDEAISELIGENSRNWGINGFYTYRHSLSDFLKKMKSVGFYIKRIFEFVSYCRNDVDIIYYFARVEKARSKRNSKRSESKVN